MTVLLISYFFFKILWLLPLQYIFRTFTFTCLLNFCCSIRLYTRLIILFFFFLKFWWNFKILWIDLIFLNFNILLKNLLRSSFCLWTVSFRYLLTFLWTYLFFILTHFSISFCWFILWSTSLTQSKPIRLFKFCNNSFFNIAKMYMLQSR
jgi:hypothetical protein